MPDRAKNPSAGRARLCLALLLAFTALVHSREVMHEFVDWDDTTLIVKNPVLNPITGQHLLQIWTKPVEALYTPLAYTAWAGVMLIAKLDTPDANGVSLNPMVFHLLNLLLHLGCVALVFDVLLQLRVGEESLALGDEPGHPQSQSRQVIAAAIGAALFAVHPLQVEAVAWISGMNNLLAGLFSLACIAAYLRATERGSQLTDPDSRAGRRRRDKRANKTEAVVASSASREESGNQPAITDTRKARVQRSDPTATRPPRTARQWIWFAVSLFAFTAALFSKPTAIVTPILIVAIDLLVRRRPVRELGTLIWPFVLLAVPFGVIAKFTQPAGGTFAPAWPQRIVVAGDAIGFYLSKLAWPTPLVIDYGRRPAVVLASGGSIGCWVALAIAIVLAAITWRRTRWIAGGFAVFVGGMALVLGLVPFDFQDYSTVADRYAYLSMLGVAILVSGVVSRWMFATKSLADESNSPAPRLPLKWQARRIAGVLAVSCALAMFAIASFHRSAVWSDTQALANDTVSKNPTSLAAFTMLGFLAEHRGDLPAARDIYLTALTIYPDDRGLNRDMGTLLLPSHPDQAIAYYQHAYDFGEHEPKLVNNLGSAYMNTGHLPQAIAMFNQVLQQDPDHLNAHINLGKILMSQGKLDEAETHLLRAMEIAPQSPAAAKAMAALNELRHRAR